MLFPRNPDNTLNFVMFETYDDVFQEKLLDELEATGSRADRIQARDYFKKQGDEGRAQSAQLESNIAALEKRNAVIFSNTSANIANNLQKSARKSKGCSIS